MGNIKLPVTVLQPYERMCDSTVFRDDNGDDFDPEEIAAALNAAPTRAFEGLTVEALGEMLSETVEEMGDPPGDQFARSAWVAACDAALLARLQAFAAPQVPQWQPIDTAPKDGTPILCFTPDFQGIFSPQSGIDVLWWDDGAWLCNAEPVAFSPTHWMPLPAAPEAQGGADHG